MLCMYDECPPWTVTWTIWMNWGNSRSPQTHAWSGEEYFRETSDGGLVRYYRPDKKTRHRYQVYEVDPLEAYQMLPDVGQGWRTRRRRINEGGLIEWTSWWNFITKCSSSTSSSTWRDRLAGIPFPRITGRYWTVPQVSLDWEKMDVIMSHFPHRQAQRA